ncbi:PIN domain-containing protein [Cellulomonas algicola]|uniref:PIN domain-containing protein n=1 Tax=Cellulomonas algicola TaxID=2071633 RepID=UPI001C3FB948|nr:PIN domain-containing protein [Cellulomonas algicola]
MIVLDTNVLSEPLRAAPDERVLAWLAAVDEPVAITAVSVGELVVGVGHLPEGRRRTGLAAAIEALLATHASGVLAYDAAAARRYAVLRERRRVDGRPLSVEDGMIAAVTAVHGATLATRNTGDFVGLDVPLVDPWTP